MRPLKLRAKGFIGIKKGLSLDEIEVDLSNVTGLIALAGENGAGKSSFIELLSPYRTLFSRNGNLNSHTYLRDSEKDFTFEYQGHTYRTLLKIDAESDRGEGFIWKNGVSVVDGKRKSYDAYIENLLGSQNLFASSVFCAQNSKKLTDMRPGELREMFAEFLRLDRLQAYETTARQAISVVGGMTAQINNRIAALEERTGKKGELESRTLEVEAEIALLEAKRKESLARAEDTRLVIDQIKERVQENAGHRQRLKDLQADMEAIARETTTYRQQEIGETGALRQKYAGIKATREQAEAVLVNREQIERAATDEAALRVTIAGGEADIELWQESLSKEKLSLANLEMTRQQLRQKADALAQDATLLEIAHEITLLRSQIQQATADLTALGSSRDLLAAEAAIAQCRDKMKDLERKDSSCDSTACSFIVGALAAAEQLPVLEATKISILAELGSKREGIKKALALLNDALTVKGEQLTARESDIKGLSAGLAAEMTAADGCIKSLKSLVTTTEEAISTLRQRLARHRLELKQLAELASKVADIRVAESRVADTETQLAEIAAQGAALKEVWARRIEEKEGQINAKTTLQHETASRIDTGAEESLKGAQEGLKASEATVESMGKQIEARRLSCAGMRAELTAILAAEKDLAEAGREHARLTSESSNWIYLRNACAKTGLQALEIDGVVPHLQYDANRLLCLTFGPNYSIRIETQDEEGREVFRVMVIREDGDETALENLSGGQRVWILKALRLALTLLSKNKSGRNFQAAFADEEDGALDVENARTYVSLYRAFMEAGGFESFFYISHKPECLASADHVLRFGQGGISVE